MTVLCQLCHINSVIRACLSLMLNCKPRQKLSLKSGLSHMSVGSIKGLEILQIHLIATGKAITTTTLTTVLFMAENMIAKAEAKATIRFNRANTLAQHNILIIFALIHHANTVLTPEYFQQKHILCGHFDYVWNYAFSVIWVFECPAAVLQAWIHC